MIILLYTFTAIVGIVAVLFIIGLILPEGRKVTRQIHYNATPETVYNIITNNEDYSYRSDLEKIVVIEKKDDFETWREISKSGNVLTFKTTRKTPFSRYEFDIVSEGRFTGHWIGELEETKTGGTLFTSTEIIKIKNPFLKTLSYLFFDIGKYMEIYQNDLEAKLEEHNR